MPSLFARLRASTERHPIWWDAALAVVLAAVGAAGVLSAHPIVSAGEETAIDQTHAVLWTVAVLLPLAFRRRFPLSVLVVHGTAFAIHRWLRVPEVSVTSMALFIAIYSAGVHGGERRTNVRAIVIAALMGTVIYETFFTDLSSVPTNIQVLRAFALSLNAVFLLAAWLLGDMVRRNLDYRTTLEERTIQLEHEREINAQRAVTDERVRIARELHDVVAHHVSVMGVQAGAARTVMATAPDQAIEALSAIEDTSRTAVAEMHRMLGMLRHDGESDPVAPQPTLARIEDLIESVRHMGLGVELITEGEERPLTPMVDLSAYRIVQEALTNTVKHAGLAKATVTLAYAPSNLHLEVVDDGRGPAAALTGTSGNGLIGMKERAQLCGGHLDAGPNPGGGFRVRARLPIGGR